MKDKKIDKYIKEQSSKLTKGLIDRRQFMMSVLATGVTLPIALSLADKVTPSIVKAAWEPEFVNVAPTPAVPFE